MRFVIITAVLGLLAQPAFAKKIDCVNVRGMAEYHYQEFVAANTEIQKIHDAKPLEKWTKDDRELYVLWDKRADEQLAEVETFANIYRAFCKD